MSTLPPDFVRSNVAIVAHGDADGICSSAIIKTKFPGALVLFSKASTLHKVIKEVERWTKSIDYLFILDIAINPKSQEFVLDRLKKVKEKYEIYFIDNHLLPWEIKQSGVEEVDIHQYVDHYVRHEKCSSSVMTFHTLYGDAENLVVKNRKAAMLAAFGAIADYAKECDLLKQVVSTYDETSIYYQAFLLKQASRIIQDDELKRTISDKLSVGILPSEIFEVVEAARESSREVDVAINFIQEHAERMGNLGVLMECPVASMGHNAFVTATTTGAPVGVAISRRNGFAYFVLRRQHDQDIHLGELATVVARDLDIDGGGEKATAGITADDTLINEVLDILDSRVGEYLKAGTFEMQKSV
ncbi:MAG: hypothetical protein ACXAE3_16140 [Candidatus Kariarchaeaceae archaeon]|jgi:RecJ-like exonuclease